MAGQLLSLALSTTISVYVAIVALPQEYESPE